MLRFATPAFLLLLFPVGCSAAPPTWEELDETYTFEQFVNDFYKSYEYETEEYMARRNIFQSNLGMILEHNSQRSTRTHTRTTGHVLGVNQFMDQHPNELPTGYDKSGRHGWNTKEASQALTETQRQQPVPKKKMDLPFDIDPIHTLPTSVDWREQGIVTPVKDQGGCGSCWAFASVAALESQIALQTNTLFSLSVQELVSCVENPLHCGGTGGCAGATAELAFDFVAMDGHGMVQEWQMGYSSYTGKQSNCTLLEHTNANQMPNLLGLRGNGRALGESTVNAAAAAADPPAVISGAVATIDGYSVLPSNDYAALMNAIAKMGPLVVSVAASGWGLYAGGVYSSNKENDNPSTYDLNHAVVLVGYGTDEETEEDYWLIRNSWRPTWGA